MANYLPQSYRSPFGDTTLTKVFVGGLAWETPTVEMRKYFEKFGEILEAVIITDKATGKSKGYGFVGFWPLFLLQIDVVLPSVVSPPIYCALILWLSESMLEKRLLSVIRSPPGGLASSLTQSSTGGEQTVTSPRRAALGLRLHEVITTR